MVEELRAYHEAGHAVAAALKGFTLTRVSIRRRGPLGGACEYFVQLRFRAGARDRLGRGGVPARTFRRLARAAAAVALGGSVAQDAIALERGYVPFDLASGRPLPLFSAGSERDERAALGMTRRLYREGRARREFLRRMRSSTERLLSSEAGWRAVRALAHALLRRRVLTGAEAQRIIGAAMRRPRREPSCRPIG